MKPRLVEGSLGTARHLLTDRRGGVAVIFGLAVIPMFAAIGLAVDVGRGFMLKSKLSYFARKLSCSARKSCTHHGRPRRMVPGGLQHLIDARGGAIALYAALTVPLLVGAAGLAVDVGSWYRTKRTVQAAADAAAYAGALDLARQGLAGSPDMTTIQAAADDAAGRNGVADPVQVSRPPTSGIAAGDGQSVEVVATEVAPLYFTGLFLNSAPPIVARSVAKAVVADACVWALHPTAQGALTVAGSAQVDLACGVVVNSNHEQAAIEQTGSSCLSATSVTVRGGYDGNCVTPEPEVFAPDYGDPLSYLEAPTVGTCDYPNKVTVDGAMANQYGGGPVPLSPGVYCGGLEIKANRTAVFAPGLYILKGSEFYIAGNAHVSNTENASGGVTFYLTGSGANYARVRIESGADVTLTPGTTGPLANVLFFQDPNAPTGNAFRFAGGATMDIEGIIYLPNGNLEFTGGSSADQAEVLLVASTLTFTGTTYLNADYARSLLPQTYFVRLVE